MSQVEVPVGTADVDPQPSPVSDAPVAGGGRRGVTLASGVGVLVLVGGLLAVSPVVPEHETPGQALDACRDEVDRQAPALDDERWLVEIIVEDDYGFWVTGFLGPAGWACAAAYDGSWSVDVTVEAPPGVSLTE